MLTLLRAVAALALLVLLVCRIAVEYGVSARLVPVAEPLELLMLAVTWAVLTGTFKLIRS